jgi:CMP-N-acetylneuraminic acid synthetase
LVKVDSRAQPDLATASAVAIVPARGGSKGVPGKNLAIVGGRSLLQRAIDACQGAASVALCVVSTDDTTIGSLAEKLGATVVWRPDSLAGDTATSESAVIHALDAIEASGTLLPPFAIMVQCTSPFVSSEDIDAVARTLADDGADSCFTASRSHRFLWGVDPERRAVAINHDPRKRLPRQELEPEFIETGAAYGFAIDGLRANQSRFFGHVMMVETDPWRTLEIDDQFDLILARNLSSQVEP